jgi:N-acyl-D-amino-acid deacylase
MFDLLIEQADVIDGTGAPAIRADIGVTGKRIAAVGDLTGAVARRVIRAHGLAACPGFIDTHVHTDAALLNEPQHPSGIGMGVTAEVLGQDGLSYAPLSPANYRDYSRYMSGLCGLPPQDLDMSSIAAFRSHYHRKCAVNTVTLIPHCAIRLEAVGFHDRPLRGDALEKARRIVSKGMDEGAAGVSFGLGFFPSAWADTTELIELAKVVAEAGGVFVGQHRFFHFERAYGGGGSAEFIEIGLRSKVKVHLAHYFPRAFGAGGAGLAASAIELGHAVEEFTKDIDAAKDKGLDITLDAYPYPSGSTMPVCRLPGWAVEGGTDAILRRLNSKAERAKIVAYLEERHGESIGDTVFTFMGSESGLTGRVASTALSGRDGLPRLEGMSWRDVAKERGISVAEMACQVMEEEDLACGLLVSPPNSNRLWQDTEHGVMELLKRPDYTVGSDAIPVGGMPHPRAFGAFPRILGRLRRRHGARLEPLIHTMTMRAADRFGLKGRGVLKAGAYADIVIFDPAQINDTATYEDPRQRPVGISHVIVNGKFALDGGRFTGAVAGESLSPG